MEPDKPTPASEPVHPPAKVIAGAVAALVVLVIVLLIIVVHYRGSDNQPSWLSFIHKSDGAASTSTPDTGHDKLVGWLANKPGVYSSGTRAEAPLDVPTAAYSLSLRCIGTGTVRATLYRISGDGYPQTGQRESVICDAKGRATITKIAATGGKREHQTLVADGPQDASWLVLVTAPRSSSK